MLLIDDLLLAPITGFQFIMRTLQRVAEEQWTDDAPLKERLLELQVQLESGEINEEQYVAAENEIMKELREIQRRRKALAGVEEDEGPPGAPTR
ncbi:MAG TPA: gas vesicle protein GvpG [Terriglobales bacterium]|nr:gas vesicle protein GvpG [Terriglobales bacterium]